MQWQSHLSSALRTLSLFYRKCIPAVSSLVCFQDSFTLFPQMCSGIVISHLPSELLHSFTANVFRPFHLSSAFRSLSLSSHRCAPAVSSLVCCQDSFSRFPQMCSGCVISHLLSEFLHSLTTDVLQLFHLSSVFRTSSLSYRRYAPAVSSLVCPQDSFTRLPQICSGVSCSSSVRCPCSSISFLIYSSSCVNL